VLAAASADASLVVFDSYGGPNSQTVTTKFQRDWQHYLCTALGYVIVRVDPRGTGYRGRKHRVLVKNRLGEVERSDVIESARSVRESLRLVVSQDRS